MCFFLLVAIAALLMFFFSLLLVLLFSLICSLSTRAKSFSIFHLLCNANLFIFLCILCETLSHFLLFFLPLSHSPPYIYLFACNRSMRMCYDTLQLLQRGWKLENFINWRERFRENEKERNTSTTFLVVFATATAAQTFHWLVFFCHCSLAINCCFLNTVKTIANTDRFMHLEIFQRQTIYANQSSSPAPL